MAGKGLDVLLSVKAATLPTSFDRFVLVSGDNDFVPLLTVLRDKGISTVLLAFPIVIGRMLTATAMRFVSLEDFLAKTSIQSFTAEHGQNSPAPPDEIYIEKGQYFEPYRIIRGLFMSAMYSITIIDPYIDDQIFGLVSLTPDSVGITILTNKIQAPDYANLVTKLRREGRTLRIYKTQHFHDRFLKVDRDWWHSGHSFKDLGTAGSRLSRVSDSSFSAKLVEQEAKAVQTATALCPLAN